MSFTQHQPPSPHSTYMCNTCYTFTQTVAVHIYFLSCSMPPMNSRCSMYMCNLYFMYTYCCYPNLSHHISHANSISKSKEKKTYLLHPLLCPFHMLPLFCAFSPPTPLLQPLPLHLPHSLHFHLLTAALAMMPSGTTFLSVYATLYKCVILYIKIYICI